MLDNNDIVRLSEVFVTKEEFKEEISKLATKEEFTEFKDEILTGQDEILEKLDILLTEKPIKDEQDKRKTDVLKIHNEALRRSKILTEEEATKIAQSSVF